MPSLNSQHEDKLVAKSNELGKHERLALDWVSIGLGRIWFGAHLGHGVTLIAKSNELASTKD